MSLLNNGDYDKAYKQARLLLKQSPDDADVHYVFGITQLMQENYPEAIEWLSRAKQSKSDNEVVLANLGVAYLKNEEVTKAINSLNQAVIRKPDYREALYNLGSAYIKNGQPDNAVKSFQRLNNLESNNADYICALADAVRNTGDWRKAIQLYQESLEIDDVPRSHINMGPLMMHLNQLDQAVYHCKKAIELTPDDMLPHKNLADCYVQMEELEEAMESYANAYEINPESAELCTAIGKVWLEISDHHEASSWYQKALSLDEDNIQAQCGLANILKDSGQLFQAFEILNPLYDKEPDHVDVLLSLADCLWDDGDAELALEHLRAVQVIQPQRIALYARIGQILASAGNVDAALQEYYKALEQSPNCIPALNGIATSKKGKLDPEHVTIMEKLLDSNKLRAGSLSALHNGLAYYYDSKMDSEKAALHMKQGNIYQWEHKSKRGWEYKIEQQEQHISRLIETFTAEYFDKVKLLGNPDQTPVFIVAMPRSGTTLTEQILARHPKVLGIGERNFAMQSFHRFINKVGQKTEESFSHLKEISQQEIESISSRYLAELRSLIDRSGEQGITRVVDKMPDNYSLIGWILTLFPNARIIHARRDSRDVALSCWMTQFGAIQWACHESHLVERIRQYERIMQHWRNVIPDRFIEMNYEDLVAEQEEESRRLIEYVDLDWDEKCLRFYESDRLVRTASITQVRRPIYKKSVARWKAYENLIPDLFIPLNRMHEHK